MDKPLSTGGMMHFKNDRIWTLAAGLAFLVLLGIGLSNLPTLQAQAGSSGEPPSTDSAVSAIVGAKVFDGEKFVRDAAVILSGDRIVGVVPTAEVPNDAIVIPAQGKTLLPGLIDGHVHPFGTALEDSLLFGVTTVLDMFSDHQQAARWRSEQAAGTSVARADVVSAGTLVTAPGGHGTQFGLVVPTITQPEEAAAFVAKRVEEGSDFIKIVLEDGSLYGRPLETLDEPTLQALVAAAHAHGKLAVAHVSTLVKGRQAVDGGVDGLVHLFYDQPVDKAWLATAVERGLFVVPTLTVLESATGTPSGASLVEDERLTPYLSTRATANLQTAFPQLSNRPAAAGFDLARSNLRALHEAGITILAGTDAPNSGTWYGASMHRELALLVEAGLSTTEALRAATSAPAEAFALDDRGRIAAGKLADLVLVDGDPEQDISATRAISRVWRRGQSVERAVAKSSETGSESGRPLLEPGPASDFASEANWQPSTDEMMGGKSTVGMAQVDGDGGSKGALEVRGEIVAGFPFPWAGAMYFPGPVPMSPVDASALTELVFSVKGDGQKHRVMFFAESLGRMPGQKVFSTSPDQWTEVVIPFEAISGMDPAGLMGVLFSGPMTPGEFAFAIDRVAFR